MTKIELDPMTTVPLATADFLLGRMIATAALNEKLSLTIKELEQKNKNQFEIIQSMHKDKDELLDEINRLKNVFGLRKTKGKHLSLREASFKVCKSKSTILRAIQSGRLIAEKNDNGGYNIDEIELYRTYPEVNNVSSY